LISAKKKWLSIHSLRTLILVILLFCILPMSLMALHIHRVSLDALQETLLSSAQSETTFYAKLLDEEISRIQLQQYDLIGSEATQRVNILYTLSSKSEQAYMVSGLYADIQARASLSRLIQNSTLYFPQLEKQLSVSDYWTELTEQTLSEVSALIETCPGGICVQETGITLFACYPVSMQTLTSSGMVLTTFLSRDLIAKWLDDYSEMTNATSFILDMDGTHYVTDNMETTIDAAAFEKITRNDPDTLLQFELEGLEIPQMVTLSDVGSTGMRLIQITPQDYTLRLLLRYRSRIAVQIGAMVAFGFLLTTVLYKTIYGPITQIRAALRKMEDGDLSFRLGRTMTLEFQDMFDQYNHMLRKLKDHMKRESEFQLLASDAEIKQLQYQISPHFLYNTYFVLRSLLVQEEYDQAARLASLMGEYLKYIVHVESPYACLHQEIDHARAYADIQCMRFGDRIRVDFDPLPESLEMLRVPRLILQPLIENAFMHGVKNVEEGGIVAVHFKENDSSLDIVVEDNGAELTDEILEKLRGMLEDPCSAGYAGRIALNNINRRILMTYGDICGLRVDRSPLGGLRCTIHIEEKKQHV